MNDNLSIKTLQDKLSVSTKRKKAELVLKNSSYINVFTNEILKGDIAIQDGYIVGIGNYEGELELNFENKIIAPGFLDGHIHIESSMVKPEEFAKAICIHGTTGIITDPHEIANVSGLDGIDYMLQATKDLPMEVYFMMPSCVPATKLDESGAELKSKDIEKYFNSERVLGLAEVMNYVGVINGDENTLEKIISTMRNNKIIDGHAPQIKKEDLDGYVTAGITSDHECSSFEEALNKLRKGQWIMIREGTAAKNLASLIDLFKAPYYNRCILVTDDKHPGDLLKFGHIDYIIKQAITLGADPIKAIKMATINTAQYFGIKNIGAIAPGYLANFVVLDNLKDFNVENVFYKGREIAKDGKILIDIKSIINNDINKKIYHSFNLKNLSENDFQFKEDGNNMRVIELIKDELLTKEVILKRIKEDEYIENDINLIAVIERHKNTGNIGLGLIKGYGLKDGAIATSVSHDSHNIITVGTNKKDMALASNWIKENQGGFVITLNGKIKYGIPLPIAGLMSDKSVYEIHKDITKIKNIAKELGVKEGIDPFMTLGFISLPVIPEIRITTKGIVDSLSQTILKTFF
ncbi:MAG: adenine deaminase [Clostridiales bacterium]|nr:adenine deaminase [Clostridiales bacterium]